MYKADLVLCMSCEFVDNTKSAMHFKPVLKLTKDEFE